MKPKKGIKNSQIENIWDPEGIVWSNADQCVGIYRDSIYYLKWKEEAYSLIFTSFEGEFIKELEFQKGKGPGKVQYIKSVDIVNDLIYIYDPHGHKIGISDINGKHIDDIMIENELGAVWYIGILDRKIYFSGALKHKIGKLNIRTGKIEKTVTYKNVKKGYEDGDKFCAASVNIDRKNNKIYLGYVSIPYRIERYNKNLQEEKVMRKEVASDVEEMRYRLVDRWKILEGDAVISSLGFDKKYIYSSFGGGYEVKRNGDVENTDSPFELYIYSKDSLKYEYKIVNKNIEKIKGVNSLVGITNEYIVLCVVDEADLFEKIDGSKNQSDFRFIILKNPLYD